MKILFKEWQPQLNPVLILSEKLGQNNSLRKLYCILLLRMMNLHIQKEFQRKESILFGLA